MKIQLAHKFEDIISIENLLAAWPEFLRGKRNKPDVQEFSLRLMDNLFALHNDLAHLTYRHGGYQVFRVSDPKPRVIHKASVRDRLLHHAIYRVLYPFFNQTFIPDSFSCRIGKGTHKASNRFRSLAYDVSKNNTRTCWVLKCDIRKFFDNIDHAILMNILREHISDARVLWLLERVVGSFAKRPGVGLPLGNLTSQLFANIHMNRLDQFAKHYLKAVFYIRYADDFVILSDNRLWLEGLIPRLSSFLDGELKLELHPKKVSIETLASGVDFLGWVNFFDHRVLRAATRRRMLRRIRESDGKPEVLQSYLGLMGHGNTGNILRALNCETRFVMLAPPWRGKLQLVSSSNKLMFK